MKPKRGPEEGTGSGSGSSTPPPPADDQQQPPVTPPATPPATTQPPAQNGGVPDGYVPIEQFRAVTRERDELKTTQTRAEEEAAEKRGEFEQLAQKREQERDEWKNRFTTTARRSAFVSAIAPDVADADAAYKLAAADGLLNDVKVDDNGNADPTAVKAAVKTTLDTYKFLKRGAGSFGGDRSGQQPDSTGFDPDKAGSRDLLREGIRRAGTSGSR